jgi:uncharacterized protein (DUF2126 family)
LKNFGTDKQLIQGASVMVATQLYDNNIEWKQHESAMQGLARELGMPMDDISQVYENALKELKSQARIKDFLSVFACRKVRERVAHK